MTNKQEKSKLPLNYNQSLDNSLKDFLAQFTPKVSLNYIIWFNLPFNLSFLFLHAQVKF
jgi:hypothetical protein